MSGMVTPLKGDSMNILETLENELEAMYGDKFSVHPSTLEKISEAFANILDNAQRGDNADLINDAVDRHWHNLNDWDPDNEFSNFDDARGDTIVIDKSYFQN